MKRFLAVINLLLFSFLVKGQVYQSMPQWGYGPVKRFDIDSSLTIPTTCGIPTLRTTLTKKSAIAFDSCNNKFYKYNPKTLTWSEVGGSSLDTTSLSNRINSKADTSALNLKLNISDTNTMLTPYLKKIDTSSLSNRINLKLNSSDTISLSNRINLKFNTSDTTNKWVNNIYRMSGKDSIFFQIGATEYKIKDSIGGSIQNGRFGNDTATIVIAKVHNDAGVQLTNGKVVAFSYSGTNSDAPAVRLANNKHDSTSANTLGFVSGTINVNDTGWVILSGKIEKLNTASFSNGDVIYLDSTSGNWTNVKPVAPLHMVYLGVIVKANGGNGSIFVKAQNGYELDEIHDVKINGKINNQVLVYSDTQKVWKNRNIYSIVDTISLSNRINLKLNSSDTASLSNRINAKGYAINIGNLGSTLSASTSYIFGIPGIAPTSVSAIRRIYIPQSGTIKGAYYYMRTTSATSNESWSLSIKLNNGSTTSIGSVATTSIDKIWSNTGLSITVNAGDYIEITTTTPAWTSLPGVTFGYGTIFIQ